MKSLKNNEANNARLLSKALPQLESSLKNGNLDVHEIDTKICILEQIFNFVDPQNNYTSL